MCLQVNVEAYGIVADVVSTSSIAALLPRPNVIVETHVRHTLGAYGTALRVASKTFVFNRVMCTEKLDVATMRMTQLAQTLLIAEPCVSVLLHHGLVKTQTRGTPRLSKVHFTMIEIGVACLQ